MTYRDEPDRDALLLAAYLDGRLSGAESAEAEALLARDSQALEPLVTANAALREPVKGGGLWGFMKPAFMTGAVTAGFLMAAIGAFEAGRIGTNSAEAFQTLTSEILLPNPSGRLEG